MTTMAEVPNINLEGFERESSTKGDGAVFFILKGTSDKIMVKPIEIAGGQQVFLLKSYKGSEQYAPPVIKSDRVAQTVDELENDLEEMAKDLKTERKDNEAFR